MSHEDLKRSYAVRWGWCEGFSRVLSTFDAALHEYRLHQGDAPRIEPLWYGEPVELTDDERERVELTDCGWKLEAWAEQLEDERDKRRDDTED